MSDPVIPLFRPDASALEKENLIRVLDSGWWGLGPETAKFEEEFARYVKGQCSLAPGTELFPVGMNSASMALEIGVRALGLPPGGRAIVPPLTFVTTATAMVHAGLDVEFCDIDEDTLCLDWEQAQAMACSPRATVVVPVWYAGTVTPVPDGFCEAVTILEDCAHAAGSAGAGGQGGLSAWSFHAVKNLAAGDGGMIVFRDPEAAERARRLRWCGISKSTHDRVTQRGYGWDYAVSEDGEKAHMNDIAAAIARAQLWRLPALNARRRAVARAYDAALRDLDWLRRPALSEQSAQHMYVVRVPAASRADFIGHLLDRNVSAGVHYRPLYHHRVFAGMAPLPVTERVWPTLATIPLFPSMTPRDIERVIEAVRSFAPKPE